MPYDELHIVDRTELRTYPHRDVHIMTPGGELYHQRWRTYRITDLGRKTVMSHPAYKAWFRTVLKRIDHL